MIKLFTEASSDFPVNATWDYIRGIVQIAFHNLISNKNIASSILSATQNPTQLVTFYKNTDPLISALYFTTGLIVIHYVMSEITKNYSQVGNLPQHTINESA